jgi:hypothetical protein
MTATTFAPAEPSWAALLPKLWNATTRRRRFGDVVLIVFLLTQCLDGVFTYIGVTEFGVSVEANPVIAGLIARFGEGTALFGAKLVAAALGMALHLREVHSAVALLAGFYLTVAILPWTAILFL